MFIKPHASSALAQEETASLQSYRIDLIHERKRADRGSSPDVWSGHEQEGSSFACGSHGAQTHTKEGFQITTPATSDHTQNSDDRTA
jgi:hypothetical protein